MDTTGKILSLGKPPLLVKNIAATVRFHGTPMAKATALDAHGYARHAVPLEPGGTALKLPADALYTVVER